MNNLKILILVFVGSIILTGFIRNYAFKKALLDVPNERSSHTKPTPRGGGLAIVATFIAVLSFMYISELLSQQFFLAMSLGSFSVAVIGFWDDHGHVPPRWRILVHFAAAGWAVYCLGGVSSFLPGDFFYNLGWFGNIVGVVLLVWMLNLFNFMDGIDGIAAVEGICVTVGAAAIMWLNGGNSQLLLLLGLAAGCMGFLAWNWPPAKIFMGDVGSGFLGFVLGVFALDTAGSDALSLWCWVILLAVFLVDATCTLLRRILRGDRFYEAHRSHAYQYLSLKLQKKNVLKGMSPVMARARGHRFVIMCVAGINFFWLFPLAWVVSLRPDWGIYLACVAIVPLVVIAIKLGAGKKSV